MSTPGDDRRAWFRRTNAPAVGTGARVLR